MLCSMTIVSDLAAAVERLGQTLESMGIPRMPARVFAFILADDQSTYTAAEPLVESTLPPRRSRARSAT